MAVNPRRGEQVLYEFLTGQILPMLKPDGLWEAPNPSPLTTDEVRRIFEAVAEHDRYQHQHFITATYDRRVIHLHNGVTHDEPIEGTPFENAPIIYEREES